MAAQVNVDTTDDPEKQEAPLVKASYKDIFWSFVLMGWTAFGGPAAHIGIFQKVFVETKRWMSMTVFNELLSLGQCMPGPTSTQVSFAIGVVQKGIPGGLMSGMLFQYPGLLMMSLAGAGAAEILVNPDDWLRGLSAGLSAAGVALVVSAAVGLARGQCKDQVTSALCLLSAVVAYYYQSNWIFPVLIVVGGLTTLYTKRKDDVALPDRKETIHHLGLSKVSGGILIATWLAIWIAVASVVNTTDYAGNQELHWFEAFYRTGSIIFGGGQVVLPLLLKDVVQYEDVCASYVNGACESYVTVPRADSWITEEQFFAGLGVVQVRLFSFPHGQLD
jgi:chromate transporter